MHYRNTTYLKLILCDNLRHDVRHLPITVDETLLVGRHHGQLERGVEVMLLLQRPVDDLALTNHQKSAVTKVSRVNGLLLSVKCDNTCCATP